MTRILNVEPLDYSDQARTILAQLGEVAEAPLTRAELIEQLPDYEVLIVRLEQQIDSEVIDAGRRLKVIVTATTGLDHIDVLYAHSKGIAVLSLRGETDFLRTITATAEHTWALLLALVRHIPAAAAAVRAGDWDRDAFRGYDLVDRRLGVLGLGRIGEKVARYGLAFAMRVFAYDPVDRDWPEDVGRCVSMTELLMQSDVLSLHVPLTAETRNLIGSRELALMPSGALLLNTARGEVLDETALVQALTSGQLAGAALDVIAHEREPERRNNGLLLNYARTHHNLLITPHLGGATYESMKKTEVFMAKKLATFLSGLL
jgi:D-3-phosphoglycerate dehydrogenase / 2-oxoglutarate reductase